MASPWVHRISNRLGTGLVIIREGGSEPFSTDYQAGLASGALENSIYLRLPGHWEEESWKDALSGAGIYYNAHRWLEAATGRYARPDPAGLILSNLSLYGYVSQNPLIAVDRFGLTTCVVISAATILEVGNYTVNVGDHSALWITGPCSGSCASPAPILYDPAGGYSLGFPGSGSAQILSREIPGWGMEDFFDYHCDSGSDFLEVYCFETDCCDEQKMVDQAQPAGAFACAAGVGGAIRGVGPFSDLGGTPTPKILRSGMNRLLRQHSGGNTFTYQCP